MNKFERDTREQALLDTALACFTTDQWENVSVAAIAARAGVAKGTVYLHFASKHEIYARLSLQFYNDLLAKCRNLTGTDSRDNLQQLVSTVFKHYQRRNEYRRVTQYCQREDFIKNLNPDIAALLNDVENQFQSLLTNILVTGTKDGSWSPKALDKMQGIYFTLKGAVNQFLCDKNKEQESQIECIATVTNYILSSVGPPSKKIQNTDTSNTTIDLVLEI